MYYSDKFISRYSENQEMVNIVRKANKVLSPYFKEDSSVRDREILYEALYSFKKTVADEHQLSMDKVYDRVYHLERIILESESSLMGKKSSRLGCFSPDGNLDNDKILCSTITVIKERNLNMADYRETVTHELVHLFSQEYFEDSDKNVERIGRCGLQDKGENTYPNEVVVQQTTLNMLEYLNYRYKEKEFYMSFDDSYAESVGVLSSGRGYASVSPIGHILTTTFDKTLYKEMFDHTDDLSNEIKRLYGNEEKLLKNIDQLIDNCYSGGTGNEYVQLYKKFSDIIFQKVEKENLNISDYVNTMNNFHNGHGCALMINDDALDMFSSVCASREIEHFYKIFNKDFNPETDLEKEINPFTRSKDCTNFLIVMQVLKNDGIEKDIESIEQITWKDVSRDKDTISLTYTYNGVESFVSAKKDLNTGLVTIDTSTKVEDIEDFKRPSFIEKFRMKDSELTGGHTFSFISKYSKISDYSEVILKNAQSSETIVIHSLATKNYDLFNQHINNVKMIDIVDAENNNSFHVLANNKDMHGKDAFIRRIIDTGDKQDLNYLLNTQNKQGITPIDIAIENKNFAFLETACEYGLSLKHTNKYDNVMVDTRPLIHHLQYNSRYEAVEGLIKGNYNINIVDNHGDTILHSVMKTDDVFFDKKGIVNALIQRGANANIENYNNLTPLMELCKMYYPYEKDIKYLCDGFGADPNYQNRDYRCAIHYLLNTAINKDCGVYDDPLKQLIEEGADVNIAGKSFTDNSVLLTPIQIATGVDYFSQPDKVLNINYEIITTLVENGADINKCYGDKPSALEMAHLRDDVEMFKAFIDGGVSVDKLYITSGNLTLGSQAEIIQYSHDKEKEKAKETENESVKENEEKAKAVTKDMDKGIVLE